MGQLLAPGVSAVVLFGSWSVGLTTNRSDYDFGVLLDREGYGRCRRNYHEYYSAVYDIFSERFGDLAYTMFLYRLHRYTLT